ncbi:MAG: DUF3604 domain-containing protein [Halioglobus sp.]
MKPTNLIAAIAFGVSTSVAASQAPMASQESLLTSLKPQKQFSPYANRDFPTAVYWGDTHVHTGMSLDAGAFGARLMPDDAYRLAKGEQLTSSTGYPVRLSRPLDWLVVADHSDNMNFFPTLLSGDPEMLASEQGGRWWKMIQEGGQTAVGAAVEIIQALTNNNFEEATFIAPGSPEYREAWNITLDAAESHNDPGKFTAFIGYEWTSTDKGFNLHRNVIYRDGKDKAGMMVPYTTLPPYGSPDPRELWKWLAKYEDTTGGSVLAIAHNGNMSNGHMFPTNSPLHGGRVNEKWAETRARWEPLYEITQIKGDGEAHPLLSPDDEFADFETWAVGNLDLSELKTDAMFIGEYGRTALQTGLQIERKTGVNPYKFGFVGATDTHTALSTAEEDNFFGKHSGAEPNPGRMEHPMAKVGDSEYPGWSMSASGYQGIWARENTREALFDAMMRKETYATTGPRMTVRFFGGWDFTDADALGRLPADAGYSKGVPMGADLPVNKGGDAPTFLVAAQRDPYSGNLDRIQIVKGWIDKRGDRHEKVYDVVWSGDRSPDADGKLPPVGNTVDAATATWTNTIGASELIAVWKDPEFDPAYPAVYYARVLEIPTPRWTAYEAIRFGVELPEGAPVSLQERAYTSAIWYDPAP